MQIQIRTLPDIGSVSTVIEPTCGDGRMLQAVPEHIPAFGIEIDPELAEEARERTGREVINADILTAEIPFKFDVVFGNPPFRAKFLDKLLDKVADTMEDGCRCGLLLPAYFMQTPTRVLKWNRIWSIYPELLPRTLFPRSQLPIIFALFTKDPAPQLKGMRLYVEADAITRLRPEFREMLEKGRGLWQPVVVRALAELGGEDHLAKIYEKVGKFRPSDNPWWREKVRQTLQRGPFKACGNGVWSLEMVAA